MPGWRAAAVGTVGTILLGTWVIIAPQVTVPGGNVGWYVAAAMVPSLLVSVLLVARLPGAAVTRVVATMTLCNLALTANDALRLWQAEHGGPPFVHDTPGLAVVLWVGTLPLLPVLLVVFPDGVPRRGLWRAVFYAQVVALAVAVPVLADQGDGVVIPSLAAAGTFAGMFLLLSGLARTVSLVRLWWRSEGERRQQVFPFVVVAGVVAGSYAVGGLIFLLTGSTGPEGTPAAGVLYAFTAGGLPAAIGLSVLRHRLYGVEIVVNRVIVAALLSATLFGVYGATVTAVTAVAGGDEGLRWGPLLAAGVTVAALGPLYRLSRTTVDQLMFGDRDRPDQALRNLAAQLGQTVDPLEIPQTIVDAVARALRLPFVALDRQTSTGLVRAASRGTEPAPGRVLDYPIWYSGERLGTLLVTPRTGQDAVTAADRAVLADLAVQAGPALYAGRLALELADSRERLRQGHLDERAHLRRALHDGLSPTLSGIAIAAAAARGRDPADPTVPRLLARIEKEAGAGATSLRALLEGLRPPGLTELGLVAAIEQRAGELADAAGLPFKVRADEPLPALDPEVEQTAYIVAVEGMVNVARHAEATWCHVTLANEGHRIRVQVADDGRGFHIDACDGDGLRSARERIGACGGAFAVRSAPGGGAVLDARLPTWAGT